MSFEDDMIEYGFTDGNDYIDYLMDEADRIYERQQIQEAEWEEHERWLESLTPEDIEEIARKEKHQKEERESLRIADRKDKLEKELILKLWAKDNPQKARLWYAHYSTSPDLENSGFENFINRLGTASIESHYDNFWTGYEEWKIWLKEYESYEEYKTKAHSEWKQWSLSIYETYFKDTVEIIFEGMYKNKAIILNNYFEKWLKCNRLLWKNVKGKYHLSKTKNDYLIQGWVETINWNDKFTVWKYLNPKEWEKCKNEWNSQFPINLWIKEHKSIWENWLKQNNELWNELYKSHYDLLWYIYTENEYYGNKRRSYSKFDPRKKLKKQDGLSDIDVHSLLISEYQEKIEMDENKKIFIKNKCSKEKMYNYFFPIHYNMRVYGMNRNEEKPEVYADRKLMELWINKHRSQWNKWKYKTLWNEKYNNEKHITYVAYNTEEYFKVWKKLYPQKWIRWKDSVYKQWKRCAQVVDRWYLWILDGNIFVFEQWARKNMGKWNKELSWVMDWDMKFAFHNLFNTYINFNDWRFEKPDEWKYWRNKIKEQLLKDKWLKDQSPKSYTQNYWRQIKMNEMKYLHQIRGNVFYEHLAVFEEDGKYGYCNDKGKLVIPLIFDDAKNFKNGFAKVNIGVQKFYEEYEYDYCETICNEYTVGGYWGIINTKGEYLVEPLYDYISDLKNGYAVYSKGGTLSQESEEVDIFKNERVHIINSKYGILDSTGKELVPPIYNYIRSLKNGLFAAKIEEGFDEKWIVISPLGEIMISNEFSNIFSCTNESMIVIVDGIKQNEYKYSQGKWGVIDNKGNFVRELQEIDPQMTFELISKSE